MSEPAEQNGDAAREMSFIQRCLQATLVFFAVGVGLFVFWTAREAFLLAFAAIIVAAALLAASEPLERHVGIARRWSVLLAFVGIVVLLGLIVWLIRPDLQGQWASLAERLTDALASLQAEIGLTGEEVSSNVAAINPLEWLSQFGGVWETMASATRSLFGAVTGAILAAIAGVFMATAPARYREGLVVLFPYRHRAEVRDALLASGRALRLWLIAKLISMLIIGLLAGVGTWLIGLPAPLALGVVAGIAEFVPFIGPVIGAVPALLAAFGEDASTLIWTLLLYVAIQQLESNIITPMLQQEMVEIPAALLIFSVAVFGLVFGMLGVIIAAPLSVVLFVLVRQLYVKQEPGGETA